ncbi:hypothetical protein BO71DRAFT_472884 [Aspergillus ellipticus CBS 707.79]|uniref:Uncharacterized protein n=1 Tax=Aspergillus ellipticus CBS 707.79 TaxID=1448320 RepID=A0A319DX74_9EURO|nr:hypothetical protein BO71DRAFT_472884 [Aspergillus ellipticus CBS 707.79]
MTELHTNTMYPSIQAQFLRPKWQSFLTTRLLRAKNIPQYLDSTPVSDCSRELLESDNPSDFIAGLVIRISLSPNMDLAEVHVDSSRETLARLHNAIRGRAGLEVEREIVAILGYLISVAIEVSPAIAPAELMELAEACQREAYIPQVSGHLDFLRAYALWRCRGEKHEVAYSLLLPSHSILATMAIPSIQRDNILRMWPIVHSISSNLKILTADWLWMIGPISWGIHSLYGLLFCTDLHGLAFGACTSIDTYCTEDKQLHSLTLETARVVWPSLEMLRTHIFGLIYHSYQEIKNKISAATSFSREELRVIILYWVDWINHQRSRLIIRGKPEFWPQSVRYNRSSKLRKAEGLRSILNVESSGISSDLANKLAGFIDSQEFKMLECQRNMPGDSCI